MKRGIKIFLASACALAMLLSGCAANRLPEGEESDQAAEEVVITLWNYYDGNLLISFNALVNEFNATYGQEHGIRVESYSYSDVDELASMVVDSVKGVPHAEEAPNIFSAYPDTAYELAQMGELVDLTKYLTEEELAAYVDGYIEEGYFGDKLTVFPVAKSVEVLVLNRTDWDQFAAATGVDTDALATMEGVTAVAELYYNWTDAQTEAPNDGKAFFGRDAVANYILIGAMQLGCEIFAVENGEVTLNFDPSVMRTIWDNYYVPMVKGYFRAESRFRSDDMKTGSIIAYVGSSSGAGFVPSVAATSDNEIYEIETDILACPQFENGEAYAAQQGAGMAVLKGPEAEVQASVEFLKWFTQTERNMAFSVSSGYLPVVEEANDVPAMDELDISETEHEMLEAAVETVQSNALYTTKAFRNADSARSLLECSMSDLAAADRATVKERLAQGMSLEEATAEFLTEEYFDAWYGATLLQLEELCG